MRTTSKAGRLGPRGAVALVVCAVAIGCSGGKASPPEATTDLRVPECEEYGRKMAACFHHDELATDMPVLARDEADRARMGIACSQSLGRLAVACR
jgi:hypothetical protein